MTVDAEKLLVNPRTLDGLVDDVITPAHKASIQDALIALRARLATGEDVDLSEIEERLDQLEALRHNDLSGRSDANCHPASAISYEDGTVEDALDNIASGTGNIDGGLFTMTDADYVLVDADGGTF